MTSRWPYMTKDERKRYYESTIRPYNEKNKERISAASRNYYLKNREEIIRKQKAYAGANKEKVAAYHYKYYQENKPKYNKYKREAHAFFRALVIRAYGGFCSCCGEDVERFLTVDHMNNDGKEHRKKMGSQLRVLRDITEQGFPADKYQIRCYNCNSGRDLNGGVCPHEGMKCDFSPLARAVDLIAECKTAMDEATARWPNSSRSSQAAQ